MEDKFVFAQKLIREAGQFVRKKMTEQLAIEIKEQYDDLVTNVDQETQELLISLIKKEYPDDHILAEENNVRHPIQDGSVWVLDPIDGTVNFIVQGEDFAIMIAYFEEGKGQFGLIYDVMNDQLLCGGGSFDVRLNEDLLEPYQKTSLNRSLIGCNSGMYAHNDRGISNLIKETLGVRVYGGAGITMLKVMTRKLFAYFSYIQPWDYAAPLIIGKKLGYCLLTLDGQLPNFRSREKVMFIPEVELALVKSFLNSET
ncbi:inositol monophosphatase family protein [Streptococcus catagoni]|uniref:inositol monophosphatase family protein n=1 Tax=Streptococcus catagoni TaxID=2654874 RepID=UPI0014083F7C|nr:inositol monophosphatase family protein [Streptococcus catagoni]